MNAERNLVDDPVPDDVPPGVLQEQRRATATTDAPACRLEQARCELGERRLAAAVRPLQHHDLAAPDVEIDVLDDGSPRFVGEAHAVECTHLSAGCRRRAAPAEV